MRRTPQMLFAAALVAAATLAGCGHSSGTRDAAATAAGVTTTNGGPAGSTTSAATETTIAAVSGGVGGAPTAGGVPTSGPAGSGQGTPATTSPTTPPGTSGTTVPPATTSPPPSVVNNVTTGRGAATGLTATTRCGPAGVRRATAQLSWTPSGAGAQQVQLTTFQNGFDAGRFDGSPVLAADASTYTWTAVNPNGVHTWRVVTQVGSDWVTSATAEFTGPVCPADGSGT